MIKLRKILLENKNIILYHGTCDENAEILLKNGFVPNSMPVGGNLGQIKYLYVTNEIDNAKWFANEKGCDTILQIKDVPLEYLGVDPEDGTEDSVEGELNKSISTGLPAYLVITKKLDKLHFTKL